MCIWEELEEEWDSDFTWTPVDEEELLELIDILDLEDEFEGA